METMMGFSKGISAALVLLSCSAAPAQQVAAPSPCGDEAFTAFDFWLGSWEVHTAVGQFAGTNTIEKVHSGCLITEYWRGQSGVEGSSINYVDRRTGEWVQVWNDASGSQIELRGGLTDEGMRMEGTIHYVSAGNTLPFRALWTPLSDGRVRQFFEQSTDGGETWVTWFEGFYSRQSARSSED